MALKYTKTLNNGSELNYWRVSLINASLEGGAVVTLVGYKSKAIRDNDPSAFEEQQTFSVDLTKQNFSGGNVLALIYDKIKASSEIFANAPTV